ncbi:MAG TPA: hypothetical protein VM940_07770 [Chthoniobacterales bacterium]|jgi:hypothetical protein|nr:hypothetical protein [Chthoniobacterales bacterium]
MIAWWTVERREELRLVAIALAITVAQIIFATLCGRGNTWHDRYISLCTWDGGWYANIVETGYHTSDPPNPTENISNVAFFPAYPVLTRFVVTITGLPTALALLVTAQFAAFLFWWFLLSHMKRWQIAPTVATGVVMLTFCHPAAFYMVVTYADSLFMASMMALLFFGTRMGLSLWLTIGAAVAGFVCSASRVVGAPLAALPVVWAWNDLYPAVKSRLGVSALFVRLWRYSFVSIATAFGTIGFFIYCSIRFGYWDLYMRTRAVGWGVSKTDYTALFAPRNFDVTLPRFQQDLVTALHVSRLYVGLLIVALFLVPIIDYSVGWLRNNSGFSRRTPFYLAAWLLVFFSASGSGLADGRYIGFLRYGFYSHVPLLLGILHARHDYFGDRTPALGSQIAVFLACALGLALQSSFCYQFAHSMMVS